MAFCGECGTNVGDAKFCPNCGAAQSAVQGMGGTQQPASFQQSEYQQPGYQSPSYPPRRGKRARRRRKAQREHYDGEEMETGNAMIASILALVLAVIFPVGIVHGYYRYSCGDYYCYSYPVRYYSIGGYNPLFSFILIIVFAFLIFRIKGINGKDDPYDELLGVKSLCNKIAGLAFVALFFMYLDATNYYYYSWFELGVSGYSSLILPFISGRLLKAD